MTRVAGVIAAVPAVTHGEEKETVTGLDALAPVTETPIADEP